MVKLLLGLFEPDSGRILIGGKPLQAYARDAREKIFGTVFQDFTRYSISLRENVGIGDVEQLSDREAVREAMQKGKVLPFLERLPKGEDTMLNRDFEGGVDLSGGQWQWIALARALMGDRPVLILDEPTSGLDPVSRDELLSILAAYIEDGEHSVLFSTHITEDLERAADYITYLRYGELVFSGSKEEFVNGFRMAKGGREELTPELRSRAAGIRTFPTGFEALIRAQDAAAFSHLEIEPASIDEIVVFTSKEGETHA